MGRNGINLCLGSLVDTFCMLIASVPVSLTVQLQCPFCLIYFLTDNFLNFKSMRKQVMQVIRDTGRQPDCTV